MYDIINLITMELEEGGFDTYGDAQRYFEQQGYSYDNYGISGPAQEDDRDPFAFDEREDLNEY